MGRGQGKSGTGAAAILYGEHQRSSEIADASEPVSADAGYYCPKNNTYVDGIGNILHNVHPQIEECSQNGCVIHAPSEHHLRHMPTSFRYDRQMMERICEHGIGHPDPDYLSFIERTQGIEAAKTESIHGCDGCCQADN